MKPLYFLIVLTSVFACKSKAYTELSRPFKEDTQEMTDAVNDATYTTYTNRLKEATLLITQRMNIPPLKKGIEGFEMRIWAPMRGYDNRNLIVLKNLNGKWSYTSTHVVINQPKVEKDSVHPMFRITVDNMKSFEVKPKDKEEPFLDSLVALGLQHSPKQKEWNYGLTPDTGNNAYTFEIANASSYRMFTYICAERLQGETEYDKRVKRFLKLLKMHFPFEFEDCRY